jgi:peptide deformylase
MILEMSVKTGITKGGIMALRNIRQFGDPVLRKECKPIKLVTPRIRLLAEDMLDTMYEANGVGLAAPQVGIVKQMVVIDIGEGPLVMVNPVITEQSGEQTDSEGCLSYPGKAADITRPNHVIAEYEDLDMVHHTVEAEGLLARAICHEVDHLHGIIYTDLAQGEVYDSKYEEEEE